MFVDARRARPAGSIPVLFASALFFVLLGLTAAGPALAWDDSFLPMGTGSDSGSQGEKGPDDGLEPFEDVIRHCEKIDGLFPFYRNRDLGKLYMEIAPDQLGEPHICALTREAAEGWFFDNGTMLGDYVFVLRREGKKIHWLRPNLDFLAPGDSAMARAIERGVSPSLIGVLDVASKPHPERESILVDPTDFFLKDHAGVAFRLKETQSGYSLHREGSYVDEIQGFPRNTEIEVVLDFSTSTPKQRVPTVPDARSFQHRYHWSLVERPEPGYVPRLADDRVGYFLTMLQDYSNTRLDSPYVRYINRWRLEKEDPDAALSPPKEPIVFWLENTIPEEYREPLRRGILNWNAAFEKAGFRDAIVVKQMPDTAKWDPADVRYHVIRWMLQPGGSYAVGPSRADPLTGEIFDADIRIAADITRVVYREWSNQILPLAGPDGADSAPHRCVLAEGRARQAAFGLGLAGARGLFDPDSPEGRAYLDAYLEGLVCHEVGHTLGLRHNFKSSTIHAVDQLQDRARTEEHGIAGSIMDYVPVNLARRGEEQGEYWDREPGVYDRWAIEYGYRPFGAATPEEEKERLEEIASRCTEPLLAFATDEDARGLGPTGIDPEAAVWDLGSDPLEWCRGRMDLADELWDSMDGFLNQPGESYTRYRPVFLQGFGEYRLAGLIAAKYVGGISHPRDHIGDPDGRPPFIPIPARTQRKALDLLAARLWSEDAFRIPAALLNKLAPERMPTMNGSLWRRERIDPAYHGMILSAQNRSLSSLFAPVRLSRIQDSELRFGSGEEVFRMSELFERVRGSIWSELVRGDEIGSLRRNLQRSHLNRLVEMVLEPEAGTPEDATTLARADLRWIAERCGRILGLTRLSGMTRAHLEETKERAEAALEAPLHRPAPDPGAGPKT
ncbi:MAG: DUF5117 domain-containing protein [Candidatus Eisenbacteria bacterium]|nr:DUF5117 domain-containing protein [Candidatus Latescibacterota bacterium]MBD3301383.1 DUF5117 domain-containing protein [Candidatus Eisenbacteria bacterium]